MCKEINLIFYSKFSALSLISTSNSTLLGLGTSLSELIKLNKNYKNTI